MSREKISPSGNILEMHNIRNNHCLRYHNPNCNETCVVHVVSVLANEFLVRTCQNWHFFNILPSIENNLHTHCCQKYMPILNSVQGCNMRKIKVVVLLVRQLQHGFTKNAKVSANLTVAHITYREAESKIFLNIGAFKCFPGT